MEISNEVKAKVFAMYLGQYLTLYKPNEVTPLQLTPERLQHFWEFGHPKVKLILRTVDQLTDEEKIEISNVFNPTVSEQYKINNAELILKAFERFANDSQETVLLYQYLLSIGIDLPSIHLGGKTLIESGLAINLKTRNDR